MSSFLSRKNWNKINKGFIFDAALFYPSDLKRPLKFFKPDGRDHNKGTIVTSIGNFKPVERDGRFVAIEQQAIVTLKPRKVLILSNDDMNHSEDFEFILIAPIMSVYPDDKSKNWYKKLIKDEHPIFVHIPDTVTGRECYLDISEVTSIHKGMLLREAVEMPSTVLEKVEETLIDCLDLGLIEEEVTEAEIDNASNE